MATDISRDGYRRSRRIGRKTQVTLTDEQYEALRDESRRTGLSQANLVRRAIDARYRIGSRPTVNGVEISFGVWRRPDAAVAGRRLRSRLRRFWSPRR
jgi:hypothetical protein